VDKSERRGSLAEQNRQNVIAYYERAFNDHELAAGAGDVRERQHDVLSE
jgi:hypothetical protein